MPACTTFSPMILTTGEPLNRRASCLPVPRPCSLHHRGAMKFALGMPALILYPPVMSPWEPEATPADILRIARTADEVGFDWLTISEHIVMPDEMTEVMGRRFPESLSAAAFLAGATKRIKLL